MPIKSKLKKLLIIPENTYECICPYCNNNMGLIQDPEYYFERCVPPICTTCKKEFKVSK